MSLRSVLTGSGVIISDSKMVYNVKDAKRFGTHFALIEVLTFLSKSQRDYELINNIICRMHNIIPECKYREKKERKGSRKDKMSMDSINKMIKKTLAELESQEIKTMLETRIKQYTPKISERSTRTVSYMGYGNRGSIFRTDGPSNIIITKHIETDMSGVDTSHEELVQADKKERLHKMKQRLIANILQDQTPLFPCLAVMIASYL